jgi:hypothetical protein
MIDDASLPATRLEVGQAHSEETPGKLAHTLHENFGIPELEVVQVISKRNEFCKWGKDTEFGKSANLLRELKNPPFDAFRIVATLGRTHGEFA